MQSDRQTFRERVADLFRRHPGGWIDGLRVAEVGGAYAWRTRVSECRQAGMVIDNRIRVRPDGSKSSEYRFAPDRLV